jgi:hypothetical protein
VWRVDAANAWAKMRVGYSLTGRQCGKLKNDEFLFNKSNKVPCNYAINNEDFTTQLTIAATNLSDKSMKQRSRGASAPLFSFMTDQRRVQGVSDAAAFTL